ncbi:uncharacterized protein VTP21DRAFT_2263 [Calcarisporiella thermophila]|uniref:uncharacterized protein n=1 Tax=Calcarisporiella thermophila TaxID=911321 RepID=UPI0037438328
MDYRTEQITPWWTSKFLWWDLYEVPGGSKVLTDTRRSFRLLFGVREHHLNGIPGEGKPGPFNGEYNIGVWEPTKEDKMMPGEQLGWVGLDPNGFLVVGDLENRVKIIFETWQAEGREEQTRVCFRIKTSDGRKLEIVRVPPPLEWVNSGHVPEAATVLQAVSPGVEIVPFVQW